MTGVRSNRVVILVVAVAALAALIGGVVAAGLIRGDSKKVEIPVRQSYAVGSVIPTSFGAVSIDGVERQAGLGAKALAGATHGIGGYVAPSQLQLEVSTTIKNLTDGVQPYAADQFDVMIGGARRPVLVRSATVTSGTLQPGAAIEATLVFVVPRNGKRLTLRYHDAARAAPFLVDLGKVDRGPKPDLGHVHS